MVFDLTDPVLKERDRALVKLMWKRGVSIMGVTLAATAVLGIVFGRVGSMIVFVGLGVFTVMLAMMQWQRLQLFRKHLAMLRTQQNKPR